MNKQHQLKMIAVSLYVLAAGPAWGALGGLQVKSALGEPFSATVVVSGDEAKTLLSQGRLGISGAALQVQVVPQGDNAVIRLRSAQPIRDPLLSFGLSIGQQTRQYTALLDPPNYRPANAAKPSGSQSASAATSARSARAATARNRAAADDNSRRLPIAASAKPTPSARHYQVGNNERLIDVARQVQPQGLNLAQTMRALVNANPHAFRNGNPDLMYRNVTLNIPAAEKLRALAKIQLAVPVATPKPEIKSEPVNKHAAASAPALAASAEASAPVKPAETAATASAAPATSAPAMQPAAKPAPQPAAPVQDQHEDGFWYGWWQWTLLGALGILLLLALWLYRRKRQAVAMTSDEPAALMPPEQLAEDGAEEGDDNDVVFMDMAANGAGSAPSAAEPALLKPSVVAPAVAATTATAAAAVTTAAAATTATSVFAEPPMTQPPQHEAAKTEDWSWLDDDAAATDATASGQAEPAPATPAAQAKPLHSDEDWLKFDAVDAPSTPAPADTAAEEVEWLAEDSGTDTPAAAPAQNATVVADTGVLEWMVAPPDQTASADVPVDDAVVAPAAADPDDALDFGDFALPVDNKPLAAQQVAVPDAHAEAQTAGALQPQHQNAFAADETALVADDIDWGALGLVDDATAAHDTAAAPASPVNHAAEVAPTSWTLTPAVTDGDSVVVETPAAVAAPQAAAVAMPAVDERITEVMPVTETAPTPESLPHTADPVAVAVADNEVLGDAADGAAEPAGHEDINMTVPMEAKLELAKMYLEIDDAATARKTLHELVDEANGEVLAEAQKLLQQLGD